MHTNAYKISGYIRLHVTKFSRNVKTDAWLPTRGYEGLAKPIDAGQHCATDQACRKNLRYRRFMGDISKNASDRSDKQFSRDDE